MLICQISDLHIRANRQKCYGIVDTSSALEQCVRHIGSLLQPPDIVIATGDLVDYGRAPEYALLRDLLAPLSVPLYLIPGNHDDRDALRAAFPEHHYLGAIGSGPIQYAIDTYPVRVIALDTVIELESGGMFSEEAAVWLDGTLGLRPEAPTLVMMHHPPFASGIGHMDKIGLHGSDRLELVIRKHPQVERIVCGHLHRSITARFGGTVALSSPSPAHQVAFDLSRDAEPMFVLEPAAMMMHAFEEGRNAVSHIVPIGTFAGPYPFFDATGLIE